MALLSGLEKSTETVKKLVSELIQVHKVYKARVVSCPSRGNYFVEFPHITEALKKENLLPAGESDIHELPQHFFLLTVPGLSSLSDHMWYITVCLKLDYTVGQ